MKRRLSFLIFCSFSLLFIMIVHPGSDKVSTFYEKYQTELEVIAKFLGELEYEKICIESANGTYTILFTEENGYKINTFSYPIENNEVREAIHCLLIQAKCKEITKRNTTIKVLRWTRLTDFGSGFAYTLGETPVPEIAYLTKLEPMPDGRWYYYESDYNQWRLSN